MIEDAGHEIGKPRKLAPHACEGIYDEDRADDGQHAAHGAPRGLQHHEDRDDAHDHVDLARDDRVGDDVDMRGHPVADQHAAQDQRPVDQPADHPARAVLTEDRIDQETQDEDEAQMDRALIEQPERLDTRRVELEQRQRDPDDGDRLQHDPGLFLFRRRGLGRVRHRASSGVSAMRTRSCSASAESEISRSPIRRRWSTFIEPGRRI